MNKLLALLAVLMLSFSGSTLAANGGGVENSLPNTMSGNWFNPDNSGWGISIDSSDAATVFKWYTFGLSWSAPQQVWMVNVDYTVEDNVTTYWMAMPSGTFQSYEEGSGQPVASFSIQVIDEDTLQVSWDLFDVDPCISTRPVAYPLPQECTGSAELKRLTRPVK